LRGAVGEPHSEKEPRMERNAFLKRLRLGLLLVSAVGLHANAQVGKGPSMDDQFATYLTADDRGNPISCGKFVSDTVNQNAKTFWRAYLGGYVSGLNVARTRRTTQDLDAFYQWVDNFCHQNPLTDLAVALRVLDTRQLGPGTSPIWIDQFIKKD
jgi:hypothetical protein